MVVELPHSFTEKYAVKVLAVFQNIRHQVYGMVVESKSYLDSFDF